MSRTARVLNPAEEQNPRRRARSKRRNPRKRNIIGWVIPVAVVGGLALIGGLVYVGRRWVQASRPAGYEGHTRWSDWWDVSPDYEGHTIFTRHLETANQHGQYFAKQPEQYQWKVDHWNPKGMYDTHDDAVDAAKRAIDEDDYR